MTNYIPSFVFQRAANEGGLKAQLHLRSPGQSAATPWVFDCVLVGQTFAPCKGRTHWLVNNNKTANDNNPISQTAQSHHPGPFSYPLTLCVKPIPFSPIRPPAACCAIFFCSAHTRHDEEALPLLMPVISTFISIISIIYSGF